MKISIIKYNAGNVQSVLFALQRIGIEGILTDNADEIKKSDKVIFPGVGEASTAMKYLRERKLDSVIRELKQPVLGICLGMQLMCKHSEEGNTNCLNIFDNKVQLFKGNEKVPQIGWNNVTNLKTKLFEGVKENAYMYFVHSYYAEKSINAVALTNYTIEYASALNKDNFYAVQFHPEKSAETGQKILENFIQL